MDAPAPEKPRTKPNEAPPAIVQPSGAKNPGRASRRTLEVISEGRRMAIARLAAMEFTDENGQRHVIGDGLAGVILHRVTGSTPKSDKGGDK